MAGTEKLRDCATALVLAGAVGAAALSLLPTTGAAHADDPLPQLEVRTFGLPLLPDTKVMVLLSGWPDDHSVWAHQVLAFGGEYHIVSLATPGYDADQGGVGDGDSGLLLGAGPGRRGRAWGYTLDEVPVMIAAAIDAHLRSVQLGGRCVDGGGSGESGTGGAVRVDVLVAHDLGALWAYHLVAMQQKPNSTTPSSSQYGALNRDMLRREEVVSGLSVSAPCQHVRVHKLVVVDVGSSASSDRATATLGLPHGAHWCVPYQFMLATAFLLGNAEAALRRAVCWAWGRSGPRSGPRSGSTAAAATEPLCPWAPCPATEALFAAAWHLTPWVGPMGGDFSWGLHAPRPQGQVRWWMGYPYYHLWYGHLFRGLRPPVPPFPALESVSGGTLFVFGRRKRAMFHTGAFEERLAATPHCRVAAYDRAGHWPMCEPEVRDAFNADLRTFLKTNSLSAPL